MYNPTPDVADTAHIEALARIGEFLRTGMDPGAGARVEQKTPPELNDEQMDQFKRWVDEAESLILDSGNALAEAGQAGDAEKFYSVFDRLQDQITIRPVSEGRFSVVFEKKEVLIPFPSNPIGAAENVASNLMRAGFAFMTYDLTPEAHGRTAGHTEKQVDIFREQAREADIFVYKKTRAGKDGERFSIVHEYRENQFEKQILEGLGGFEPNANQRALLEQGAAAGKAAYDALVAAGKVQPILSPELRALPQMIKRSISTKPRAEWPRACMYFNTAFNSLFEKPKTEAEFKAAEERPEKLTQYVSDVLNAYGFAMVSQTETGIPQMSAVISPETAQEVVDVTVASLARYILSRYVEDDEVFKLQNEIAAAAERIQMNTQIYSYLRQPNITQAIARGIRDADISAVAARKQFSDDRTGGVMSGVASGIGGTMLAITTSAATAKPVTIGGKPVALIGSSVDSSKRSSNTQLVAGGDLLLTADGRLSHLSASDGFRMDSERLTRQMVDALKGVSNLEKFSKRFPADWSANLDRAMGRGGVAAAADSGIAGLTEVKYDDDSERSGAAAQPVGSGGPAKVDFVAECLVEMYQMYRYDAKKALIEKIAQRPVTNAWVQFGNRSGDFSEKNLAELSETLALQAKKTKGSVTYTVHELRAAAFLAVSLHAYLETSVVGEDREKVRETVASSLETLGVEGYGIYELARVFWLHLEASLEQGKKIESETASKTTAATKEQGPEQPEASKKRSFFARKQKSPEPAPIVSSAPAEPIYSKESTLNGFLSRLDVLGDATINAIENENVVVAVNAVRRLLSGSEDPEKCQTVYRSIAIDVHADLTEGDQSDPQDPLKSLRDAVNRHIKTLLEFAVDPDKRETDSILKALRELIRVHRGYRDQLATAQAAAPLQAHQILTLLKQIAGDLAELVKGQVSITQTLHQMRADLQSAKPQLPPSDAPDKSDASDKSDDKSQSGARANEQGLTPSGSRFLKLDDILALDVKPYARVTEKYFRQHMDETIAESKPWWEGSWEVTLGNRTHPVVASNRPIRNFIPGMSIDRIDVDSIRNSPQIQLAIDILRRLSDEPLPIHEIAVVEDDITVNLKGGLRTSSTYSFIRLLDSLPEYLTVEIQVAGEALSSPISDRDIFDLSLDRGRKLKVKIRNFSPTEGNNDHATALQRIKTFLETWGGNDPDARERLTSIDDILALENNPYAVVTRTKLINSDVSGSTDEPTPESSLWNVRLGNNEFTITTGSGQPDSLIPTLMINGKDVDPDGAQTSKVRRAIELLGRLSGRAPKQPFGPAAERVFTIKPEFLKGIHGRPAHILVGLLNSLPDHLLVKVESEDKTLSTPIGVLDLMLLRLAAGDQIKFSIWNSGSAEDNHDHEAALDRFQTFFESYTEGTGARVNRYGLSFELYKKAAELAERIAARIDVKAYERDVRPILQGSSEDFYGNFHKIIADGRLEKAMPFLEDMHQDAEGNSQWRYGPKNQITIAEHTYDILKNAHALLARKYGDGPDGWGAEGIDESGWKAGDDIAEQYAILFESMTAREREMFNLAVLLHDSAILIQHASHQSMGAVVAEHVADKLGLTADEKKWLVFLVQYHDGIGGAYIAERSPLLVSKELKKLRLSESQINWTNRFLALLTVSEVRSIFNPRIQHGEILTAEKAQFYLDAADSEKMQEKQKKFDDYRIRFYASNEQGALNQNRLNAINTQLELLDAKATKRLRTALREEFSYTDYSYRVFQNLDPESLVKLLVLLSQINANPALKKPFTHLSFGATSADAPKTAPFIAEILKDYEIGGLLYTSQHATKALRALHITTNRRTRTISVGNHKLLPSAVTSGTRTMTFSEMENVFEQTDDEARWARLDDPKTARVGDLVAFDNISLSESKILGVVGFRNLYGDKRADVWVQRGNGIYEPKILTPKQLDKVVVYRPTETEVFEAVKGLLVDEVNEMFAKAKAATARRGGSEGEKLKKQKVNAEGESEPPQMFDFVVLRTESEEQPKRNALIVSPISKPGVEDTIELLVEHLNEKGDPDGSYEFMTRTYASLYIDAGLGNVLRLKLPTSGAEPHGKELNLGARVPIHHTLEAGEDVDGVIIDMFSNMTSKLVADPGTQFHIRVTVATPEQFDALRSFGIAPLDHSGDDLKKIIVDKLKPNDIQSAQLHGRKLTITFKDPIGPTHLKEIVLEGLSAFSSSNASEAFLSIHSLSPDSVAAAQTYLNNNRLRVSAKTLNAMRVWPLVMGITDPSGAQSFSAMATELGTHIQTDSILTDRANREAELEEDRQAQAAKATVRAVASAARELTEDEKAVRDALLSLDHDLDELKQSWAYANLITEESLLDGAEDLLEFRKYMSQMLAENASPEIKKSSRALVKVSNHLFQGKIEERLAADAANAPTLKAQWVHKIILGPLEDLHKKVKEKIGDQSFEDFDLREIAGLLDTVVFRYSRDNAAWAASLEISALTGFKKLHLFLNNANTLLIKIMFLQRQFAAAVLKTNAYRVLWATKRHARVQFTSGKNEQDVDIALIQTKVLELRGKLEYVGNEQYKNTPSLQSTIGRMYRDAAASADRFPSTGSDKEKMDAAAELVNEVALIYGIEQGASWTADEKTGRHPISETDVHRKILQISTEIFKASGLADIDMDILFDRLDKVNKDGSSGARVRKGGAASSTGAAETGGPLTYRDLRVGDVVFYEKKNEVGEVKFIESGGTEITVFVINLNTRKARTIRLGKTTEKSGAVRRATDDEIKGFEEARTAGAGAVSTSPAGSGASGTKNTAKKLTRSNDQGLSSQKLRGWVGVVADVTLSVQARLDAIRQLHQRNRDMWADPDIQAIYLKRLKDLALKKDTLHEGDLEIRNEILKAFFDLNDDNTASFKLLAKALRRDEFHKATTTAKGQGKTKREDKAVSPKRISEYRSRVLADYESRMKGFGEMEIPTGHLINILSLLTDVYQSTYKEIKVETANYTEKNLWILEALAQRAEALADLQAEVPDSVIRSMYNIIRLVKMDMESVYRYIPRLKKDADIRVKQRNELDVVVGRIIRALARMTPDRLRDSDSVILRNGFVMSRQQIKVILEDVSSEAINLIDLKEEVDSQIGLRIAMDIIRGRTEGHAAPFGKKSKTGKQSYNKRIVVLGDSLRAGLRYVQSVIEDRRVNKTVGTDPEILEFAYLTAALSAEGKKYNKDDVIIGPALQGMTLWPEGSPAMRLEQADSAGGARADVDRVVEQFYVPLAASRSWIGRREVSFQIGSAYGDIVVAGLANDSLGAQEVRVDFPRYEFQPASVSQYTLDTPLVFRPEGLRSQRPGRSAPGAVAATRASFEPALFRQAVHRLARNLVTTKDRAVVLRFRGEILAGIGEGEMASIADLVKRFSAELGVYVVFEKLYGDLSADIRGLVRPIQSNLAGVEAADLLLFDQTGLLAEHEAGKFPAFSLVVMTAAAIARADDSPAALAKLRSDLNLTSSRILFGRDLTPAAIGAMKKVTRQAIAILKLFPALMRLTRVEFAESMRLTQDALDSAA